MISCVDKFRNSFQLEIGSVLWIYMLIILLVLVVAFIDKICDTILNVFNESIPCIPPNLVCISKM